MYRWCSSSTSTFYSASMAHAGVVFIVANVKTFAVVVVFVISRSSSRGSSCRGSGSGREVVRHSDKSSGVDDGGSDNGAHCQVNAFKSGDTYGGLVSS